MARLINYDRYDPFRHPAWRSNRVLEIISRPGNHPGQSTPQDDRYVRKLREFMLRYQNQPADETGTAARKLMSHKNPGLYWAYLLNDHRNDTARYKVIMLEARILAAMSDQEIAAGCSTLPEVVEWYEALYFNVHDRLHAHDWILDQVLMPAFLKSRSAPPPQHSPPQPKSQARAASSIAAAKAFYAPVSEPLFDCTLKWFGYFGGPYVLDDVISGFRRGAVCRSREGVPDWWDQHTASRLRQRSGMAAQTFEVARYNVVELFNLHAKLIEIDRGTQDQEQTHDQMHQAILGVLSNMEWASGKAGAKLVAGTPIEKYDGSAAELRDDELMMLENGQVPGTIASIEQISLPAANLGACCPQNGVNDNA